MKLLHPKDLKIGDKVQSRDVKTGLWYDAQVIAKRGRGANLKVKVKYSGFNDRYNVEFRAKDAGLRERLSKVELKKEMNDILIEKVYGGRTDGLKEDGQWEIERLIKKRRRANVTEYLVRWVDWAPEYDTWESNNLAREIIEEFEEEQAMKAKPPKLRPEPFTCALTAGDSPELLECAAPRAPSIITIDIGDSD